MYLMPLLASFITRTLAGLMVDFSALGWKLNKPDLLLEYGVIARNILNGDGYSYTWITTVGEKITLPTAYMPPGQVFIDVLSLAIFGDSSAGVVGVFIVNVILGVCSVYLIGKITTELFSQSVTRVTLWVAALYPPFVYATTSFGVTSAVIFINALILYTVILLTKTGQTKYGLYAGIGFGVLHLFRGEAPLIFIVTIIVLLYHYRKTLLPKIAIMTLTTLAIIAPWTIRNVIVFERFIPISSNAGLNFWRGNNALSAGDAWTDYGAPIWSTDELWAKAEPYLDSGIVFDKMYSTIYFNDALTWIKDNPIDAALLSCKKALIFWTIDPSSKMHGKWAYIAIYLMTMLLLCIGAFRVRKYYKQNIGIQIVISWCVAATLIAMAFFPLVRLQVIMIATVFPIVGYGAYTIHQRFFSQKQIS